MKNSRNHKSLSNRISLLVAMIAMTLSIMGLLSSLFFENSHLYKVFIGFIGGSVGIVMGYLLLQVLSYRKLSEFKKQPETFQQQSLYGVEGLFLSGGSTFLNRMIDIIQKEKRDIVIVSASMKGLFEKHHFIKEMLNALKRGVRIDILLSHPEFLYTRNYQEHRSFGDLEAEFFYSLKIILNAVYADAPLRKNIRIRVYRGAPTMFMLATSEVMIISPYTHTYSAYEWPCFLISRESPLFEKYYSSHFMRAWDSSHSIEIADADKDLEKLMFETTEKHKDLAEKSNKLKNILKERPDNK